MLLIIRLILLISLLSATSVSSQTILIKNDSQDFENRLIKEQKETVNSNKTIVKGYYSNDSLAYQYQLFKNEMSGIYKVYHPNGKIKYFSVFMNGSINGSWKEFDPKGKLIISGLYKNGKKNGSWFYFEQNKVEIYRNGVANGRWRIDEGWTPRVLYKYKNGVLINLKYQYPQKNIF